MSEATNVNVQVAPALGSRSALGEYLPALLPLVGAAIMVVVRKRLGPAAFRGWSADRGWPLLLHHSCGNARDQRLGSKPDSREDWLVDSLARVLLQSFELAREMDHGG